MKIWRPEWDCDFLKLEVRSVQLNDGDDVNAAIEMIQMGNVDFLQIFMRNETSETIDGLKRLGANYFGTKIEYGKTLSADDREVCAGVKIARQLCPEMYELAFQAGHQSRYRLDSRLRKYFEPMYRIWMEKILTEPANYFLLHVDTDGILLCHQNGRIELLAVAERARRRGIAGKLCMEAENIWRHAMVKNIKVATQGENINACRFYEAIGFKRESSTGIWHLWKK